MWSLIILINLIQKNINQLYLKHACHSHQTEFPNQTESWNSSWWFSPCCCWVKKQFAQETIYLKAFCCETLLQDLPAPHWWITLPPATPVAQKHSNVANIPDICGKKQSRFLLSPLSTLSCPGKFQSVGRWHQNVDGKFLSTARFFHKFCPPNKKLSPG